MSADSMKSPDLLDEMRSEYDFRGAERGRHAERFRRGALLIGDIELAGRRLPCVAEAGVSDWVWVETLRTPPEDTTVARYHSSNEPWWEERGTGRRLTERVLHWAPIRRQIA